MTKKTPHEAFTLPEMLIVIGIVSILAALLAVGVLSARSSVLAAKCKSNLRQLGLGLQQFVSDHHVYPLFLNSDYHRGLYLEHHTSWISALGKQAFGEIPVPPGEKPWLEKGIWDCPSSKRPSYFPNNVGWLSYGYNANGVAAFSSNLSMGLGGQGSVTGTNHAPPVSEGEVVSPSAMFAIGDGFIGGQRIVKDGLGLMGRVPKGENYLCSTARAGKRHAQRANIVFCDNHVEAISLEALFGETTDMALRRWNRDNQPHRSRLP